jgi:nucleotidyltransferase substrate binding protein (TIGR01987 family)
MEKINLLLINYKKALITFDEILKEPFSIIVRDAAIQRFEYTFEIFWKLLKEYLKEYEGVICDSPKSCIREAFKQNLFLNEKETIGALNMVDDRNMTSHTYHENVAQGIYKNLKNYYKLMFKIYNKINKNIK